MAGYPSWRLTLCLFGAWMTIFLILSRGVKSSGKCSYFLALFPYVIMIALLVRSVTLEGAAKGILFFITPQWHELANPKVIHSKFFNLSKQIDSIQNSVFASNSDLERSHSTGILFAIGWFLSNYCAIVL